MDVAGGLALGSECRTLAPLSYGHLSPPKKEKKITIVIWPPYLTLTIN